MTYLSSPCYSQQGRVCRLETEFLSAFSRWKQYEHYMIQDYPDQWVLQSHPGANREYMQGMCMLDLDFVLSSLCALNTFSVCKSLTNSCAHIHTQPASTKKLTSICIFQAHVHALKYVSTHRHIHRYTKISCFSAVVSIWKMCGGLSYMMRALCMETIAEAWVDGIAVSIVISLIIASKIL